jgi:ATP-binding cassette subfamily C protein CydC
MTLARLARELIRGRQRRFVTAAALVAAVQLAGLVLLGLSGWFVAASAAAGLAGLGLVFDFFRPSAIIRLTTPLRALARYGERMTGHDATLRALHGLRLRLFTGLSRGDAAGLATLRSAEGLNRLTADLDAVEGLLIRLILPALAVPLTLLGGAAAIALLAGPWAAGAVLLCHLAGLALLGLLAAGRLRDAANRQEQAFQTLRGAMAEEMRLRGEAALQGAVPQAAARVMAASQALELARQQIDRAERRAAAVLTALPSGAAALVLLAAPPDAARVLAAMLVAIAMAEAPRGLWRGLAEAGRMQLAASRMGTGEAVAASPSEPAPAPLPLAAAGAAALELTAFTACWPGQGRPRIAPVTLRLRAGEWAGLAGPSGSGKTTLLYAIAGLLPVAQGRAAVSGRDVADWPEPALRSRLLLVPQRPALIGGTVADNLALAAPGAGPGAMQAALQAVCLWSALAGRGGLATPLGAQGAGLSGGEARRLALARAVLRQPGVLLLDEPTEGLDMVTARAVLAGLRSALPETAVLIVSHRAADLDGVGQIVQAVRFPPPGPAGN